MMYEKKEKKVLTARPGEGCAENEDKIIHTAIDIPPIAPTEILHSKVIKVTYFIRVSTSILRSMFSSFLNKFLLEN